MRLRIRCDIHSLFGINVPQKYNLLFYHFDALARTTQPKPLRAKRVRGAGGTRNEFKPGLRPRQVTVRSASV